MLEKYLNKKVVIEEKQFQFSSTLVGKTVTTGMAALNKIEGIITAIDDEFIEIDNKMIIAKKFIYRIKLV